KQCRHHLLRDQAESDRLAIPPGMQNGFFGGLNMNKTTTHADGHPLRVFLVEDSVDVRELMIENLTMIPGVVVSGVSESEGDALNQLNSLPCDVLIVDIQLKKGNGIN